MTHDERDRRDWPEDSEPVTDPELRDAAAPDEPPAGDSEAPEAPEAPRDVWRTDAPAADEARASWPTEAPEAGEPSADAWPTAPPERGEPPVLPPRDDAGVAPEMTEPEMTEPETTEPETTAPAQDEWRQAPPAGEPPREDAWGTREAAEEPMAAEPHEMPPSEVEAYSGEPPPAAEVAGAAGAAAAAAAAHSVPAAESATGESTQCPRCGTENRPGLAFCRNCGQRLVAAGTAATVERPGTPEGTQACPRCGTHNRAGVAFCQNCGANLRGTGAGYVPPAVAAGEEAAAAPTAAAHAILGPIVLLIGLVGLATAYLLPFAYGTGSLFDRAWGADGYGVAFWSGYPDVGGSLADQVYFGLVGPAPILALVVLALAVAGFVKAAPGMLQGIGLVVTLAWSVAVIVLFAVVELGANWDGDLVSLLRLLTPAGIIFFLTALILVIGSLTRFARS